MRRAQRARCKIVICSCTLADNAAAARVTEQRKVLGDHEQHEVQRLSRQQSGGAQRSPKKGRRSADAGSSGQALLSIVAVALIFAGFM